MKKFPLITMLARHLGRPIAIMDTETTGLLHHKQFGIVEFGCLLIEPNGIQKTIETLINPGFPIPLDATKVHGIRDEDVQDSPNITGIAPIIQSVMSKSLVSGFNICEFDIEAIRKDFSRYGLTLPEPPMLCDVREVYMTVSGTRRGKLHEVAYQYKVTPSIEHRALGDVLTTANILESMLFRHGVDFVLGVRKLFEARNIDQTQPDLLAPQTKEKQETQKDRLNKAILDFVHTNGKILPKDYPEISAKTNTTVTSVSFRVSNLFEEGLLKREHIEDKEMQSIINRHIHEIIDRVGIDKLKPIKEELDRITGNDIDYTQIRIAINILSQKAEETANQRGSNNIRLNQCRP